MWANNYINIPFKIDGRTKEGIDCWGLVCLVYKEQLGTILPQYDVKFNDCSSHSLRKMAREIDKSKKNWDRVEGSPKPFDVVLLRNGKLVSHIGIVIDREKMLHITDKLNSCVESFLGIFWRNRVEGFYRWKV